MVELLPSGRFELSQFQVGVEKRNGKQNECLSGPSRAGIFFLRHLQWGQWSDLCQPKMSYRNKVRTLQCCGEEKKRSKICLHQSVSISTDGDTCLFSRSSLCPPTQCLTSPALLQPWKLAHMDSTCGCFCHLDSDGLSQWENSADYGKREEREFLLVLSQCVLLKAQFLASSHLPAKARAPSV